MADILMNDALEGFFKVILLPFNKNCLFLIMQRQT